MENIKVGVDNKVYHEKYGSGVITNVESADGGYNVTISFDSVGEKTLLSFVNPLEK